MIGVLVFGLEKPNFHRHFGHHELWHLLVLAGSAVHFTVILLYIV
jgi:hemolysin III